MSSVSKQAQLPKWKGKKRKIAKLLKEGKLSDKEIAQQVGSNKPYVWNVRSQLKQLGLLDEKSKISAEETEVASEEKQERKKLDSETGAPNEQPSREETGVQLEKEDFKIIYREFFKQLKPPEIVRKYGYRYELVDAEYKKFLRYSTFNVQAFQKWLFDLFGYDIRQSDSRRAKELARLYEERSSLNDQELYELIELMLDERWEDGYNVRTAEYNSGAAYPSYLEPIPCNVCNQPLDGSVLVNPNDKMGQDVLRYCKEKGWGHASCHEK